MKKALPYKAVRQWLHNENLEPRLFWGLRMAVATTLPMVWGAITGRIVDAEWIALAAESLCWIELKGSLGQRLRLLIAGVLVLMLSGAIGGIAGHYVLASVAVMLVIGFLSGLFKNLGDRGNGLAFVLNVFFILNLAFPFGSVAHFGQRMGFTVIGGLIAIAVSFLATMLHPTHQPYRRTIAMVWHEVGLLASAVKQGWDGKSIRNNIRVIYEQEVKLRHALDNSLHFFQSLSHEIRKSEKQKHALAQIRKSASIIATQVMAMGDELQHVQIHEVSADLRSHIHGLIKAIEDACNRMKELMLEVRDEELLILETRIERMNRLLEAMQQLHHLARDPAAYKRLLQLGARTLRMLQHGMRMLEPLRGDLPSYKSYSLVKTMHILHPKYLVHNVKLLFNFNTFTTRYALRLAIASALSVLLWKYYGLRFGYWMPFTVAVVVQPYFGATFKKAVDRILGTLLGAVAGGLLLFLPDNDWVEIVILFICTVFMVYYVRTKYSLAAFFITVGLVVLFEVNESADPMLLVDRASITGLGSLLAVVAGYALLPTWDKKYLPRFLAQAIGQNFQYFLQVYYQRQQDEPWVKYKQQAESANSNAFDSFHRYMEEPHWEKHRYKLYYQLIIANMRITHELNNQYLHNDNATQAQVANARKRIQEAYHLFIQAATILQELEPKGLRQLPLPPDIAELQVPVNFSDHHLEKIIFELKSILYDLKLWQQETTKA